MASLSRRTGLRRETLYTNTYSYVIQQIIRYRHPVVKPHTVLKKKIEEKKRYVHQENQKAGTPGIEFPTLNSQGVQAIYQQPVVSRGCMSELYASIRTNIKFGYSYQKTKKEPPEEDSREHGRGRPRQAGETSNARSYTTPNGVPRLVLGRLWLKTWSKSDLSVAETT